MKTRTQSHPRRARDQRQQRGMAVIVVMVIISILLIYVTGNLRTLHSLQRDLKQVEQKQLNRLQAGTRVTNSIPLMNTNRLAIPVAPADGQ